MERKSYLTDKAFNKYLWASVLSVAAAQIANIVDASLVGNIIGSDGLAAVVIVDPAVQALFAISCLYIPSCTMLAGMAIGRGDRQKANTLFSLALIITLIVGATVGILGLLFMDSVSQFLCQSEAIRPMVNDYLKVTFIASIPMLMMLTLQQFVETDGSPRLVSVSVIVGNIVNVALDILFMRFLGWGMAGAAWATCIMYVVCCLLMFRHFMKKDTLRLYFKKFKEYISAREIIVFGIPLFLSTVLISLQQVCYNATATKYMGECGLVVLAVCIQLLNLSMIILTGTLRTIQPVGAILRGIDDSVGMLMLIKRAYSFMAMALGVFTLALVFCPEQIAGMLGVTEQEAMETVHLALPAFSLNIIMQALLYNLMPIYQFYEHHRMALFLSVGQTLLPIPCFWFLAAMNSQLSSLDSQLISPWYGFFIGQLITAVVLIVSAIIIRRKNRNLTPIVLIPRTSCPSLELSFAHTDESMHQTFDQLSAWLMSQSLSKSVIFKLRVIAEELMSNISRHSEQAPSLLERVRGVAAYADVRLAIHPDHVILSLTDNGIPFNPIENKDKGYGLMIANGAADDINYKYQFGQNMTTVKIDL